METAKTTNYMPATQIGSAFLLCYSMVGGNATQEECETPYPEEFYHIEIGKDGAREKEVMERFVIINNPKPHEKNSIEIDPQEQIKVIHKFASNILENIKDIDEDFSSLIEREFWNLV